MTKGGVNENSRQNEKEDQGETSEVSCNTPSCSRAKRMGLIFWRKSVGIIPLSETFRKEEEERREREKKRKKKRRRSRSPDLRTK